MILHYPTRIGDRFCDQFCNLASIEGFDIEADGSGCSGCAQLYTPGFGTFKQPTGGRA
jgi:hypothetical protein